MVISMNNDLLVLVIFLITAFVLSFTFFGIILCKNNNAIGIVLLFLSLNIFGLILGFAILYNSKNKEN